MSMCIIIKYSLKAAFNAQIQIIYKCLGETETNDQSKLAKIGLKSHMHEGREP
jgi:hypothetical protein